jgi:hypothetical protein
MYPYQPLSTKSQEIRLIYLEPGSGSDEIKCSLVNVSFPPTPDLLNSKNPLFDQILSPPNNGLGQPRWAPNLENRGAERSASSSIPGKRDPIVLPIYEALSYTVSM